VNALKNVLAGTVNLTAGLVFVFAAEIDWAVAGLIAIGSLVGGALGGTYGRRLSPTVLRGLIVIFGIAAILRLTLG
ncbi:MAG TPA: TSUP family transporter, partial [Solirubrobacterales bacterium]|nr:TSUP family transporter [Solirubrobacterales bacterium]